LLAARYDVDAMARLFGVDSLAFVSIDGLYRAMGEPRRDPLLPRFCDACFTGDYPIPLIDADDGKVSVQLSLLAEPA
jgi:amidophosphoribosyltransferase